MASTSGRTATFNTVAALGVWTALLSLITFQGHLKAAFAPVFEAVEGTYLAYGLAIFLLNAMAEPSPFVMLISVFLVLTPPKAAYEWLLAAVPELWLCVVVMMSVTFFVVYWSNGLLCLALEYYCGNQLESYKIQTLKSHSRPSLWKLVRNIAFNTLLVPLVSMPFGMIAEHLADKNIYRIPGPFEIFWSCAACIITNEICFFYGHWLFHANKFFYGKIHKIHHEFKAPIALAAVYCHPIELFVSDFFPLGVGVISFNLNLYFGMVWVVFAVLGTQTHHCGYRWPWIGSHGSQPDFHDYHHEKFNCNYGNIGFLDALHGTLMQPENRLTAKKIEEADPVVWPKAKEEFSKKNQDDDNSSQESTQASTSQESTQASAPRAQVCSTASSKGHRARTMSPGAPASKKAA
jgi:methylsterol monooxygenase